MVSMCASGLCDCIENECELESTEHIKWDKRMNK